MKIRVDTDKLPPNSSGDIMSDIVMATGKGVECSSLQGSLGMWTFEIDGGTSQDLQNLKEAGFEVEEVKE